MDCKSSGFKPVIMYVCMYQEMKMETGPVWVHAMSLGPRPWGLQEVGTFPALPLHCDGKVGVSMFSCLPDWGGGGGGGVEVRTLGHHNHYGGC